MTAYVGAFVEQDVTQLIGTQALFQIGWDQKERTDGSVEGRRVEPGNGSDADGRSDSRDVAGLIQGRDQRRRGLGLCCSDGPMHPEGEPSGSTEKKEDAESPQA